MRNWIVPFNYDHCGSKLRHSFRSYVCLNLHYYKIPLKRLKQSSHYDFDLVTILGLGRYTEKYRYRSILYSGRRNPRPEFERELGNVGTEPGAAGSTLSTARRFKSR
jgi:hypothetical protein